jgi:ubiquinone biosynthesis protein UbiJ
MATRKMTFTIPEDLAAQFVRRVSAQDRSRYASEAIADKLRERQDRLIRACEVANNDADVLAIEQEWDALSDKVDRIEEPWDIAPTR